MDSFSVMNEPFTFSFAGKDYSVKKATLGQVMQFQRHVKGITAENDAAADVRLISFAIYLILHASDSSVTEDYVLENARGDLDFVDIMSTLGFMNQQKIEALRKTRDLLGNINPPKKTGGESMAQ